MMLICGQSECPSVFIRQKNANQFESTAEIIALTKTPGLSSYICWVSVEKGSNLEIGWIAVFSATVEYWSSWATNRSLLCIASASSLINVIFHVNLVSEALVTAWLQDYQWAVWLWEKRLVHPGALQEFLGTALTSPNLAVVFKGEDHMYDSLDYTYYVVKMRLCTTSEQSLRYVGLSKLVW